MAKTLTVGRKDLGTGSGKALFDHESSRYVGNGAERILGPMIQAVEKEAMARMKARVRVAIAKEATRWPQGQEVYALRAIAALEKVRI
jgi:hypothetical protein